jgi:riboflavin biosynthesis pyrimidine reductase
MTRDTPAILERPLECLFEDPGLFSYRLPRALTDLYGGPIGFNQPRLYANFVASIDGIVALERGEGSGSTISGHNLADRFVMGLLRACAEAVIVAAGTFRATPRHRWTADHVFPPLADEFGRLRIELGLARHPTLFVVSASGDIDSGHPALREPSVILTTREGASRLRGSVPQTCKVKLLAEDGPSAAAVINAVSSEGFRIVLTEGGPTFLGQLIAEGLLDELFLTIAPRLIGPAREGSRKSLVESADVLGLPESSARLLSLRLHGSYLFLRYVLGEQR